MEEKDWEKGKRGKRQACGENFLVEMESGGGGAQSREAPRSRGDPVEKRAFS